MEGVGLLWRKPLRLQIANEALQQALVPAASLGANQHQYSSRLTHLHLGPGLGL